MADEFDGVPGVPDGDSPEQPGDSGAGADKPTVDALSELQRKFDEQFRAFQSGADRRIAEAKRQAEEAERRRQEAEERLKAVIKATEEIDPKAADELIRQAEIAELRRRNELLEAERQLRQWEDEVREWARERGLDPDSPEFEAAKEAALASGSQMPLMELAIREEARREAARIIAEKLGSSPPATAQPNMGAQDVAPRSGHVVPPAGGQSTTLSDAEQERLFEQYIELARNPSQNSEALERIKRKLGI